MRVLERFHEVVISPETIKLAISASGRFLRNRALPERAIDLIDEAGAGVKLLREKLPPELAQVQVRLRRVMRELERAIFCHDVDQARKLSEEEREAREKIAAIAGRQGKNTRVRPLRPTTFWK